MRAPLICVGSISHIEGDSSAIRQQDRASLVLIRHRILVAQRDNRSAAGHGGATRRLGSQTGWIGFGCCRPGGNRRPRNSQRPGIAQINVDDAAFQPSGSCAGDFFHLGLRDLGDVKASCGVPNLTFTTAGEPIRDTRALLASGLPVACAMRSASDSRHYDIRDELPVTGAVAPRPSMPHGIFRPSPCGATYWIGTLMTRPGVWIGLRSSLS